MQSVSETGCLLTPLSVLAEPCQVLFLFFISPLDSRSLRPEIVIGWAHIDNRWRKALS